MRILINLFGSFENVLIRMNLHSKSKKYTNKMMLCLDVPETCKKFIKCVNLIILETIS